MNGQRAVRAIVFAALTIGYIARGGLAGAQQEPSPPAPAVPPAQPPEPHGKVLYSRSEGEAGASQPTDKSVPAAQSSQKITDAERSAVAYTSYKFEIRLRPEEHAIAVAADLTIRNDGEQPLSQLPLQISSTLQWESMESEGQPLRFVQSLLDDDADHTGQVREAVAQLPRPLSPKGEIRLKVIYSGPIELSAQRLQTAGSPADLARHSDWDQIGPDFTGLRGFGSVLWYPATSPPMRLGDGARLFTETGRQKLRQTSARISMQVVAEYFDDAPNLAVLDGHVVPVVRTASPTASFPGVVTCSLPETSLGFASPTLFLLARSEQDQGAVQIYARPEDRANGSAYLTGALSALPAVQQWLGTTPRSPLVMIDLADPDDIPFEDGDVLFTGMAAADPEQLAGALSHSWSHAYFQSPRAWLDEGVAQFMGALWMERSQGREAALQRMEATRSMLALAEPADPGAASGETLLNASDTAYYRVKAAYVLWMLRDLAGDTALSAALRAYLPAEDASPEYFEHLLERASGKNLRWFFDSWVYQDRGLPDLSIAGVFPAHGAGAGRYIVAVDVSNDGYADVEVPVTVRALNSSVTERVQVLGRSKATHRFLIDGPPTEVVVNDGSIPEVQASVHQQTLTMAEKKP